ncbi:MAG: toll/interleukin-1 receptor domain-containing protein [Thermoanaerobaculia bacterium]
MTTTFSFDVFLSYSSEDKPRVRCLAKLLCDAGLSVWFADSVTQPGEIIHQSIVHGLEASRTLVLCLSPSALGSAWVEMERSTFLFRDPSNAGRRFIPLVLADCEIPDNLRIYKYIDYRHEGESAFAELLASIRRACDTVLLSPRSIADREAPVSPKFDEEFVLPLHVAEDTFLQVLLSQFSIHRSRKKEGEGFEISVFVDDNTPTIWSGKAKTYLKSMLPEKRRRQYQTALDNFLLHGQGADDYPFDDPEFVFRFASGGTLPVITFSDNPVPYYCLFFRDEYPVGWNIANGGCDTRAELIDPMETIDRELREELIIADLGASTRYVLLPKTRKSADYPAHAVARRLWARKCPDKNVAALKVEGLKMEWVNGPDSLRIQIGEGRSVRRQGFFLNINGEDFGIEFDKIARIELPSRATLFDGEIDDGVLVNRPIGLFSVDRFNGLLKEGAQAFLPDFIFYGAERYDANHLDYIVKEHFMRHLESFRAEAKVEYLKDQIRENKQYGLCPVTMRIATRFKEWQAE